MTDLRNLLRGLWLPLVTPFRSGALDEASLRRLVRHYAAGPIDGLILAATSGEGMTLTMAELERLVSAVRSELSHVKRNIPIVLGVPLPSSLFDAKNPLIVGLVATAERISHVRQNRLLGSTSGFDPNAYADRSHISEELAYARQLCTRHGWPMIDVSRRSIEETAAAIVALRRKNR